MGDSEFFGKLKEDQIQIEIIPLTVHDRRIGREEEESMGCVGGRAGSFGLYGIMRNIVL